MDKTLAAEQTSPAIHPATLMGHLSLSVASLEPQIDFYQHSLGFALNWRAGAQAGLGIAGVDLLRLVETPGHKRYRGVTGLYHFALLFPDRRELARRVARLFALHHPNFPTDHIMTKTTYLDDPEGNGIELYTESPEDGSFSISGDQFVTRRTDGTPSDGREPLDVEALLAHLQPDDRLDQPIPESTRIGHVHLHVRNVQEAVDFYAGVIGFDVMGVSTAFRAAFVSAGGYHHHLGLNTWQGEGAPLPPEDALGLRYFTVQLPDEAELKRILVRIQRAGLTTGASDSGVLVRDPSGNGVNLTYQQH